MSESMNNKIVIHELRRALTKIHLEAYNTQAGIAAEALNKTDLHIIGNFRLEVVKNLIELAESTGMTQISELTDLINKLGK